MAVVVVRLPCGILLSVAGSRLALAPGTSALQRFAQAQLETGAMCDNTSGAYLLGPNPGVAPFAFHVVIFPPLNGAQIESYERSRGIRVPSSFREFLQHFNGLRAGGLSMYGLFDATFQKNPEAVAAYVPFDAVQEQETRKRGKRPCAELFPIGVFQARVLKKVPWFLALMVRCFLSTTRETSCAAITQSPRRLKPRLR